MIHNRRNQWIFKGVCAIAGLMVCALTSAAQPAPTKHPVAAAAKKPTTTAAAAPEQKYKGIWEPVNYPDDVNLYSVYFVNDKVGWAAGRGQGGFILHTTDGGAHWEIQLGDPNSAEDRFVHLRFLDTTHGWAYHAGKLVRTLDGTSWEEAGSFPSDMADYQFVSPQYGIAASGYSTHSIINVTVDGGRNWKPVFQCATTLQVNGLTQHVACYLHALHFPSPRVGYAVGGPSNGEGFAVVAKTEDGGATWKLIFATTDMNTADAVFFTDENHGVIRLMGAKVFLTSDGGQSWRSAPSSVSGPFKFADPETGVFCIRNSCSFTSDGGEHWLSREFRFPTTVEAFSYPRRDCIYVVGEHGMVYRYRVVPADYTAQGSIDAPLLSSYGGAINSQLTHLKDQVQQLQARIGSAGGSASTASSAPPAPAPANRGNSKPAATPAGQPRNQASIAQSPPASGANAPSFGQDSSAAGGFSQGAAPTGADSQSAAAGSGFSQDASFSQDAGFSQDVVSTPPSQPLQDCCGAQMQSLQTDLGSFSQQAPAFAQKYRNLNLLFVGLNMFSDLMGKARGMRDSFLALKKAPNLQSASAALQDLAAKLENTSQSVSGGFQNISAGNSTQFATGAVGNMLGKDANGTANPDPNAAPGAQPAPQDSKKKGTTADELKKKVKKIPIPWPH
jgi:photosystem II stability/assembly factor-like uncharacterized protein